MRRGFSVMEILVVMFIALVVGAGIYIAYVQLTREAITKSLMAKSEVDVSALLYQLRKDMVSTGFGMHRDLLVLRNDGVINCNNLSGFANTNSVIARCKANDRQEELYYLSLAARQFSSAGCWSVVDGSGRLKINSTNYILHSCPGPHPTMKCVIMTLTKNLIQVDTCPFPSQGMLPSFPNTLIFPACFLGGPNPSLCYSIDRSNYHWYFAVRYYTNTSNLRECAPHTLNLLRIVHGDSVPQPIASCVGAFRVRYFDGISYRESMTDIRTLRAIRLCLLVQVGARTSTSMDLPTFSANCGGNFTVPTQDWRWYRWKVVEEDILLENLR